jgi:hypothetical protein
MQLAFWLLRFLVESALLWLLIVWATWDENLRWKQLAGWAMLTVTLGITAVIVAVRVFTATYSMSLLAGMGLQTIALWGILQNKRLASLKVLLVLAGFLGVRIALAFLN